MTTRSPVSTSTSDSARTEPAPAHTVVHRAAPEPMATFSAPSSKPLPAQPITPLLPGGWSEALRRTGLARRYPSLVNSITYGFNIGIPPLTNTLTPPNHRSSRENPAATRQLIQKELDAGRYGGPFSLHFVSQALGHIQTSPLGLVPKDGTSFRLIQDFSFPRGPDSHSINNHLHASDWPTTWGAARALCQAILLLPPSARAAVRDVDAAYRTIPLHPSQWPGTVLHDDEYNYYVDYCLGFGLSLAAGAWGHVADALADILRRSGMAIVLKCVDDFIFLTVPLSDLDHTNRLLRKRRFSTSDQPQQRGGTTFFLNERGEEQADDGFGSFQNLTLATQPHQLVTSLQVINDITTPLGLPWKASKDRDFAPVQQYTGFIFNIPHRTVRLPEAKRLRYLDNVRAWLGRSRSTLAQASTIIGQLQHACFVHSAGRKRLAFLRQFLAVNAHHHPDAPLHPPRHLRSDLLWWESSLSIPDRQRCFAADSSSLDIGLYTDASEWGLGITLGDAALSLPFDPAQSVSPFSIVWAEALAFEIALRIAIHRGISDSNLVIHCDNAAVVATAQTGYMRNQQVMLVLQR
ncbi:hypothetical protein A4X03_0g8868, partial [Tilletia caries]